MNIIIGGDLVPYGKNTSLFETGEIEKILGIELLEIWNSAEHRFFNLECPITNTDKKLLKCGPNIRCSTESINGIKKMLPTCITLANNHIMDYSERGLMDTIRILNKNNVDWVGVGESINCVKKTFDFFCGKKIITIYNCCEHEFSIATNNICGANPYDEFTIEDDIRKAKEKSDYLIVIYHGGKEHYRYPSPCLQKKSRKMIEYGADLIICQHSHCIGCEERYKGGIIVYGQGNFVFNKIENEFWNTSLLVDVDVSSGYKISYIPIVQTEYGTRLANENEAQKILKSFKERSEKIKDDRFVQDEYKKYAKKELGRYLVMVNRSIILKIIYKLSPSLFEKISFNYVATLNALECEAHNELFVEGLKCRIKEEKIKHEI